MLLIHNGDKVSFACCYQYTPISSYTIRMATIRSLEQEITSLQKQAAEHRKEYDKLKDSRLITLASSGAFGALSARSNAKQHEAEAEHAERRIEQLKHDIETIRQSIVELDRQIQHTKNDSREKIRYIEEQSRRRIDDLERQKHYLLG